MKSIDLAKHVGALTRDRVRLARYIPELSEGLRNNNLHQVIADVIPADLQPFARGWAAGAEAQRARLRGLGAIS